MKHKQLLLAVNIKTRRTELGLSLERLAQICGVSRAMLSDIEREAKNPTIAVVCQIAEGLNCSVSELLGEKKVQENERWQVLRQAEAQVLVDTKTGIERRILNPLWLSRGLEVISYTIPPGEDTGVLPPHQQGVVEHITVEEGQLYCYLAEQKIRLEKGDSLFFQADVNHKFSNPSSTVCHYLLIIDSSQAHRR